MAIKYNTLCDMSLCSVSNEHMMSVKEHLSQTQGVLLRKRMKLAMVKMEARAIGIPLEL